MKTPENPGLAAGRQAEMSWHVGCSPRAKDGTGNSETRGRGHMTHDSRYKKHGSCETRGAISCPRGARARRTLGMIAVGLVAGVALPALGQTEANLTTAIKNFSIEDGVTFAPDDGDVLDECIAAGGPYKLLRFDFNSQNQGRKDVVMGPIPPIGESNDVYVWSVSHGHHHIRNFNNYDLISDASQTVKAGLKQAFCLMDIEQIDPAAPDPKFDCGQQGVTWGWTDVYSSSLPCQYIDITGVPDGIYGVVAETNVSRVAHEGDVYDNRIFVRLKLASNTVSVLQPDWRPPQVIVPATGQLQKPAVVARMPNRFDLFYRGVDGKLYTKWQDETGTWSPAGAGQAIFDPAAPYALAGDPTAYSAKRNWIDVFGADAAGAVYQFQWRGDTWAYSSLGGSAAGPPHAVAPSPDRAMVAVIWSDGSFRYRFWDGAAWTGWASLGGDFVKEAPTLVASGETMIHAFARRSNGKISYRRFNDGAWTSSWTDLGGNLVGRVSAASFNVNRVDVVGRGTSNTLQRKTWNGSSWSSSWISDGVTNLASLPTALGPAPGSLDIFYYYLSGGTVTYRKRHFNGSTWTIDSPSASGSISAAVVPVVSQWSRGMFDFFHVTSDGAINIRPFR